MALSPYPILRLKLTQPQALKMRFLPAISGAGLNGKVNRSGDTMTGSLILDHDPVVPMEAATKQYVDDSTSSPTCNIEFIVDGGGNPITTGIKGDLEISFGGTIEAATLLADLAGNLVMDIQSDAYGNYPPTGADSIIGVGTKPTLAGVNKSQDITLTNWDRLITAGDILRFNVDSTSGVITRVTLSLKVTKD